MTATTPPPSRTTAQEDSSLLSAALSLADAGLAVFPCEPQKKRPLASLGDGGFHHATTDPDQITAWWTASPSANIGVHPGAARLIVFDLDRKNGLDGVADLDELARQHGKLPAAPEASTPSGGAHVYFSLPPGVDPPGNARGSLPKSIEVRSASGYILAPPSFTAKAPRTAEGFYAWTTPLDPALGFPIVPAWILSMIAAAPVRPVSPRPPSLPVATSDMERASACLSMLSGSRDGHDEWIGVGMALHGAFSGSADALALWDSWSSASPKYRAGECERRWNSFKRSDGLGMGSLVKWARDDSGDPTFGRGWNHEARDTSHVDVAAIVASAKARSNGTAKTLVSTSPVPIESDPIAALDSTEEHPSPEIVTADDHGLPPLIPLDQERARAPIPLHAFPPTWRALIEHSAAEIQVYPDFTGATSLGVIGSCLLNKIHIAPAPAWEEPAALWIAVVAKPAERKSAAFNSAFRAVESFQRELESRSKSDVAARQVERARLEKRIKRLLAIPDPTESQEQEAIEAQERLNEIDATPDSPRLFTQDATPEALDKLLCEHGGMFSIADTEGGFFASNGRYSNGGGASTANINKCYDARSTLLVDRVSRKAVTVYAPSVAIVTMLQNEVARGLFSKAELAATGFLARFVFVLPDSRQGERETDWRLIPAKPPHVDKNWSAVTRRLLAMPRDLNARVSIAAGPAEYLWNDYLARFESRLKHGADDFGGALEWAGKHAGRTARIALCLHCFKAAEIAVGPVRAADLAKIQISRETIESAILIANWLESHSLHALDILGISSGDRDARPIRNWLVSNSVQQFSRADALAAMKGTMSLGSIGAALATLEAHRHIFPLGGSRNPLCAAPSDSWSVHPDLHATAGDPDSAAWSSMFHRWASTDPDSVRTSADIVAAFVGYPTPSRLHRAANGRARCTVAGVHLTKLDGSKVAAGYLLNVRRDRKDVAQYSLGVDLS